MPKLRSYIYAGTLSLLSTAASAHDGHDHTHWMSDSLHLLFYGSLVPVLAASSLVVIKHFKNRKGSNKNEELSVPRFVDLINEFGNKTELNLAAQSQLARLVREKEIHVKK